MMGCCVSYEVAKATIEEIVQRYHPQDAKIFLARRESSGGLERKVQVGVVVKPDDMKNSQMFDEFIALGLQANSCTRVLYSQVDLRGANMVDLFILEVITEVVR